MRILCPTPSTASTSRKVSKEESPPPKLAFSKPFYWHIDDIVKRKLAASKYTSKLAGYTLSVFNTFFASTTHADAEDALVALLALDVNGTTNMLNQVVNILATIKDMQRGRMIYLGLTYDPSSTPTQRDFANNVRNNEFTPPSRTREDRQEPTRSTPSTNPPSTGPPNSHPPRLMPHAISRRHQG